MFMSARPRMFRSPARIRANRQRSGGAMPAVREITLNAYVVTDRLPAAQLAATSLRSVFEGGSPAAHFPRDERVGPVVRYGYLGDRAGGSSLRIGRHAEVTAR
jgi:hypothetical protein